MFFLWPRANLSIDFTSRRSNNFNATTGNDDDDDDDDIEFDDDVEFDDDAFEFNAIEDSCCPAWNIFNLLKMKKSIIYNSVIEVCVKDIKYIYWVKKRLVWVF